ncbi:membrane-spanning 4-domains subfamily A member 12 [Loxodonta africana]|nr:membrane-spanning 4-domains subfamily A member 12 [Loxodonta africana]
MGPKDTFVSPKPTTQTRMSETAANPYPPINTMASWSQQPPGVINPVNQAPGSQPPFLTSPGIYSSFQHDQANIQMVNSATGTEAINFKEEAQILGGIQIVIGVMHIGFGVILGLMNDSYKMALGFASLSFISGYTFWGGISFIISGSLSISAAKVFSRCLLKGSLGMNVVSAAFAGIGMILLVVDMSINGAPRQDYWALLSGKGISAMLVIFSLLEFCITCVSAHSSTQAIDTNPPVVVIPTMYGNPSTSAPSSVPLTNDGQPAYGPRY